MSRHDSVTDLPRCAARHVSPWFFAGTSALLLVLAGCFGPATQHRAKSIDESEVSRYDLPTVGEKTTVGNAEPSPVGGVGLVEGLEGTGGDCPADSYRSMLAESLRKEGVENVKKLLTSPDCALVIIEGHVLPGAVKGDKIDLEVKLPPGSRATSLRGGVLRKCHLYNYDFARNLKPDYNGPLNLMKGTKTVLASGPLLVNTADGEEASAKQGRIWQGGQCLRDYALALVMNQDSQQARLTNLITERINNSFHAGIRNTLDSRLAHTADNTAISLKVPVQYRHNIPRYLRVVRAVPLTESVDLPPKESEDKRSYRQKLTDDLLEPSRTIIAALRLEALGQKSIPVLKNGLKHPHPLVRFSAAEALVYLGSPSGCEELGVAATKYPVLRAYALSALASLDEAASQIQLKKLISSDLDDEARAGAFRALTLLNERDPLVRGERLNESFWIHRVAHDTKPFVHVSTVKKAEIVLFGQTPTLRAPFSFLAGEFAVTASEEGGVAISRVPLGGRPVRKVCSLELEDVIRSMAELGAGYGEVLAMLQQAQSCESVSCRVRMDALPQPTNVHELAKLGKDATGADLLPAGTEEAAEGGTR